MARTHYEVLGVRPDANAEEIRRSYHKLAKDHHPDRFTGVEDKKRAEDIFSAMTEAFNVLTNNERRKAYDQKLRDSSTGETATQKEAKGYVRAGVAKLNQGDAE